MDQVQIEMALDKNYLVPDKIQKAYLMVKLTAPELLGTKRPKQNLSFVIDRSGSMHGDKLDHTKKAVAFAVRHLVKEDLCSVIAFDDEISVVVPQHRLEAKDVLKRQIQAICSGGTTNLSGGMLTGFKEVKKTFLETQINRILLLTDGMALSELGSMVQGVDRELFKSHVVHFDSCLISKDSKEVQNFMRLTGATFVTGFASEVDFIESLAFEMIYLDYLRVYDPKSALQKLQKDHNGLCDRLKFEIIGSLEKKDN